MSLRNLALLALLGLVNAQDKIGFGPYFSLGPTSSWIREAKTTLVLPEVPSPQKDRLALWPGMGTSGGDLIQALAVSFSDPAANCGATAGQWCTWASTLQGTQLGGKQVPANAGDEVTMHCSGQAQGWGTAVECQDDACKGTAAAHVYADTTIILDAADSSFGDTLAINEATSSGLKTTDNGKTWTVSTINVQAHTYNL
ncbi:Pc16g03280 [Penicillium rubens Wisconsin 54-1255]|uniref:Pc16g03280 protein n=1 Tax=Penicillium rubens (strain ATCC 28089 / DSM 1075 / NRRL 1951 / Wisconsin 54-1255) TaxID=500485 RepID=B6H7N3_PENRW|nr:Pc16g03280 [Penicillium rubens Wisconsin 54-1255]